MREDQRYFSVKRRQASIDRVITEHYDLAIIGGGITGAGIALDAASRGLKTILLEKKDFASGTSSKSTKLIHGGLRYLKQLEFGLVHDTGTERAVLHRLAPHLIRPEKMLLPLIKGGTYGKRAASFGLWIYDILARVVRSDRRKMLGKTTTKKAEPLLDESTLLGAGLYGEYRTDDARLTIELIKTASRYGAFCLNYCNVQGFEHSNDRISGICCSDLLLVSNIHIKTNFVVSAAGPWVDLIRQKNQSINHKKLHLTKGVHIVVGYEKLPLKQSIYFDIPDGRMIFAIPRGKTTYIGTTDTTFHGNPDHVTTTLADAQYLVEAVNATFPTIELSIGDIQSTWAGLRPLIHQEGKDPSEISRKDEIFLAKDGLISIAGGKLTGYRKMAKKVTNLVVSKHDKGGSFKPCQTQSIPLLENPFENYSAAQAYKKQIAGQLKGIADADSQAEYLVANYGSNASLIVQNFQQNDPHMSDHRELLMGELEYTVDYEMVTSSADFFIRRTGRLYFDIDSVFKYQQAVNQHLASLLGWSEEKTLADMEEIKLEMNNTYAFRQEMSEREDESIP